MKRKTGSYEFKRVVFVLERRTTRIRGRSGRDADDFSRKRQRLIEKRGSIDLKYLPLASLFCAWVSGFMTINGLGDCSGKAMLMSSSISDGYYTMTVEDEG